MNPITVGHEKLVNKIEMVAKKEKADAALFLSHSQDKKKNPLKYEDKIRYAQKAFGKIARKSNANTIIKVLQELDSKYDEVILIVGSDRVDSFNDLLPRYNGKDYAFESIRVVSAGQRDPDSDDVDGMSGTKMRELALTGKIAEFKKGLPKKLQSSKEGVEMYNKIREWGGITEELTLDEVMNIQQRLKKKSVMRRLKGKIAAGRRRAKYKVANKKKLTARSSRKARDAIRSRVAGKQGQKYHSLSLSARMQVDKKIQGKKKIIKQLSKRLMPKVRAAEMSRVKSARAHRKEDIDILNAIDVVYTQVIREEITAKVEKNFAKKAEKYGVGINELKEKYIVLRQTKDIGETFDAINHELVEKKKAKVCWKGYKQLGMKEKNGKQVPNCVPEEKGHFRDADDGAGMTQKGVDAYRSKNPGSKLQTAVTKKPSEMDPDSKDAKRRKAFCARSKGWTGERGKAARKRWNC